MTRLGTRSLGVAVLLAVLGSAAPVGADPVSESYVRQRLGPGEAIVYWIHRDGPTIQTFTLQPRHPAETLTDLSLEALDIVPVWLYAAVYDKLHQLPDAVQDGLAQALLDAQAENPLYVDEVAFCVANIAREELAPAEGDPLDPELLLENVRTIYAAAERLDYVELVEDGGVTTTRYRLHYGNSDHYWELDWHDYYWWVVHPRTGHDHSGYVDPRTGDPLARSEGGRFWREYFMDPAPTPDYAREFSLKVPLEITDDELGGWGPSAQGWLVSEAIDPIVVVARAGDGRPVWLRYTYHHPTAGGTNNGTVIATTMPVEQAYVDGRSDLLVNLLSQGDGVVRMIPGRTGNRVLVLKDRDPFGAATVELVLGQQGYDYEVMDSTAFAAIAAWEDLEALDFEKIVVPSDQPRQLYQRLSDQRDVVNGWVGRAAAGDDMVFEFHGALDPANAADDWTDLEMPGQLRGYSLTDTTDAVVTVGYPRPMDVLASTTYAWDGQAYPGLSGDRALDATTFALDKLGYFVSQNLDDNVSEIMTDWAGPDGDCSYGQMGCTIRTEEAERVVYAHYGNCGENAHAWTAVGRLGLLPVAEVGSMAEDHVWNEILLDEQWLPCQTDWSDNATRINHPANGGDKETGGGKDLSVVSGYRGDGLWLNRTPRYSNTVTFDVTVTDPNGLPADGARIVVANENYYDDTALTVATVEFADVLGHAEVVVGDLQNYYFQVSHPSGGVWPDPDHVEWVACAGPDATNPGGTTCEAGMPTTDASGTVIPLEVQLTGEAIDTLEAEVMDGSDVPLGEDRLNYSFGVAAEVLYGSVWESEPVTHTRWNTDPQDGLDVYLLDQDNVERFADGLSFTAHQAWLSSIGMAGSIVLPDVGVSDYFLLVSNDRHGATAYHFNLDLNFQPPEDATEVPPDDGPQDGCGCQSSGSGLGGGILLLLLVLGLIRRKR